MKVHRISEYWKKIVESEAKLTFSIAGIDQNDLTDFV